MGFINVQGLCVVPWSVGFPNIDDLGFKEHERNVTYRFYIKED